MKGSGGFGIVVHRRSLDRTDAGPKRRASKWDDAGSLATRWSAELRDTKVGCTPDVLQPSDVEIRSGLRRGWGCLGNYQVLIFLAVGFEFHFTLVEHELDSGVHGDQFLIGVFFLADVVLRNLGPYDIFLTEHLVIALRTLLFVPSATTPSGLRTDAGRFRWKSSSCFDERSCRTTFGSSRHRTSGFPSDGMGGNRFHLPL
jgi:hypothetical protein